MTNDWQPISTAPRIRKFNHDHFWQWAANMASFGHKVFVSEYSVPSFNAVHWECVWEQTVKSSLSANGRHGGSKQSVERLFAFKP